MTSRLRPLSAVAGAVVAVVAMAVGVAPLAAGASAASHVVPVRTGWVDPAAHATRVVLVGDSLAQESAPYIAYLTAPKRFVPKYWGGTAPCDWADVNLQANRSTVVVISFTGNSLTPCMSDGAGGHLEHQAFVDEYRYDIGQLIDHARRAGARVLLVGQPMRAAKFGHDDRVIGINEIYRTFAARYADVSFVDAGAAVEAPDGSYSPRLPCTAFDVACDPDGETAVRGDGIHFCPVPGANPCPVFSSGALRFSLSIADAANDPVAYE
jgi:hypothetical protein